METASASTQLLNFSDTLKLLLLRAGELLSCLQRENRLLQGPDVNALHQLNGEKSGLLVQIEALDRKRAELLAGLGFTDDPEGMKRLLATTPKPLGLETVWRELRDTLEACQRQNQINGGAIELSRRHAQQALILLRGDPNGNLYDQRGDSCNRPDGRSLARA